MKSFFTPLKTTTLILAFLLSSLLVNSQSVGDYQTVGSGNWNNTATWARYNGTSWITPAPTAPTASDGVITILNTHTVTVALASGGDQIVVASGGALTLNNTLTVAGTGTNLTINGTITVFSTLNGTGEMVVNGTMDWTGGTLGIPTNLSATAVCNINNSNKNLNTTLTVTNGAVVNWSASQINFNSGTLTNNGTINITGNDPINGISGTNLFTNSATGVITKSIGAVITNIGVPFTNNGVINVTTGTFRKPSPGNFTNTGTLNISSGATVSIAFVAMTLDPGTVLSGAGILQLFTTGTSNVNLALTVPAGFTFRQASGILAGSGSLSVDGVFDFYGGTLSVPATINSGASMTTSNSGAKSLTANLSVNGTFTWTLGDFTLTNAAVTINGSMIANLASSQFFNSSGAGSSLTISSSGILNKTSTAGTTLTTNIGFTNSGTIYGIGTINTTGANGTVTNTGVIRPGNSPGVLALNSLMLGSNTPTLRLEIVDGSGVGIGHDQLDFTAASVDVSNTTLIVNEITSAPVQSYTIMHVTGGVFSGNFAAISIPLNYSITYNPGVSSDIIVNKLGSTLPAVWGDFNAIAKNNNQVLLNWTTLQESNVSNYVVEYSSNGMDYTTIGSVTAVGTTNSKSTYNFVHTMPDVQKTNYYRIKQIDFDNKSAYSVIRPVRFSKGAVVSVLVTPNPVRDRLQVSVQADKIQIMMVDLSGRTVKNMNLQPGNHDINVSNLAPGMYQLVVLQDGVQIETQKIIKQ